MTFGLKKFIAIAISAFKRRPDKSEWQKKASKFQQGVFESRHCHKYFDLIKCYADHPIFSFKAIPLFSIPLVLRPTNIIELGAAFTSYPEKYDNPWGLYDGMSEGLLSTRILLTACRFLNKYGIKATLTSIDIRDNKKKFEDGKKCLQALDLFQYWRPFYGTDSLEWLKKNKGPIHLAYVDSSHTYKQVKAELEALALLMAPDGLVIIDDGFIISDPCKELWRVSEDDEGRSKGGEFGAILDFLKDHPEWHHVWSPEGMVYLCRSEHIIRFLSE